MPSARATLGSSWDSLWVPVRRWVRIPLLLLWSTACCSLLAWAVRKPRPDAAFVRAYRTHLWAKGACRILGLRLRIRGGAQNGFEANDVDDPRSKNKTWQVMQGSLWVSNHLSYLDIVVLAALGPVQFVSKSEVAEWPGLGILARMNGSHFLSRSKPRDALRVSEAIEASLASGLAVMVFPEGTSSDGRHLLPFRPALFDAASRGGHPVWPMALRYFSHHADAKNDLCWHGDRDFVPHFWKLLGLPGFVATLNLAASPWVDNHRRGLSDAAYRAVSALGRYPSPPPLPGGSVDDYALASEHYRSI